MERFHGLSLKVLDLLWCGFVFLYFQKRKAPGIAKNSQREQKIAAEARVFSGAGSSDPSHNFNAASAQDRFAATCIGGDHRSRLQHTKLSRGLILREEESAGWVGVA